MAADGARTSLWRGIPTFMARVIIRLVSSAAPAPVLTVAEVEVTIENAPISMPGAFRESVDQSDKMDVDDAGQDGALDAPTQGTHTPDPDELQLVLFQASSLKINDDSKTSSPGPSTPRPQAKRRLVAKKRRDAAGEGNAALVPIAETQATSPLVPVDDDEEAYLDSNGRPLPNRNDISHQQTRSKKRPSDAPGKDSPALAPTRPSTSSQAGSSSVSVEEDEEGYLDPNGFRLPVLVSPSTPTGSGSNISHRNPPPIAVGTLDTSQRAGLSPSTPTSSSRARTSASTPTTPIPSSPSSTNRPTRWKERLSDPPPLLRDIRFQITENVQDHADEPAQASALPEFEGELHPWQTADLNCIAARETEVWRPEATEGPLSGWSGSLLNWETGCALGCFYRKRRSWNIFLAWGRLC